MSKSLVDSIEQYCKNNEPKDSHYLDLKQALDEYHRMIETGTLVPRGNTLQNNYNTVYEFPESNYQ